MDLGDQRAGRVNDPEAAAFAQLSNCGRDAMGGVDDALAVGDVVDFMNEDCAFFSQLIDYIAVVDDLTTNVDGSAKGVECDFHYINRAHHASAKAARLE